MRKEPKPTLGFSGLPSQATGLFAPVAADEHHLPHTLDDFSIELDQAADTATIYLSEVDPTTGVILVKRSSMSFPLGMLADLVRRRPEKRVRSELS